MAAQSDAPERGSPPRDGRKLASIWRKVFGKDQVPNAAPTTATAPISPPPSRPTSPAELIRRVSRKVVPGLPRAKTFKRQQSEDRTRLEPTETSQAERRAVSVDRRVRPQHSHRSLSPPPSQHHESAPDFVGAVQPLNMADLARSHAVSGPPSPVEDDFEWPAAPNDRPAHQDGRYEDNDDVHVRDQSPAPSTADTRSVTSSAYEDRLKHELETEWILNLSMHFRDKSKREKFFVTYRQAPHTWRRVTISLDYRNAPEDSLELDLSRAKYQRDKSSRIYEAIRDSLQDIQFYDTVTNLKLQTTDGRLHVHVVEDVNEIIHYPTVQNVMHLNCRLIHERELKFDSHMSGFVYKVEHQGQILIKKEIPGPDTVDEFLYEVNALSALTNSPDIINFYGVVVDDYNNIKGLLIDYAEQGALVDVIYHAAESGASIDWQMKQRWARQIVQGLSDVHEAGFVQGDFTLSNIVIDEDQNAKIIDINRRGCPVGWEPPEATPLIECNQRISMYIGVKSDLFQLGMVLWALATMEDEPEAHRRPLRIGSDIGVPKWYRTIVNSCLNPDPRCRLQAAELLKHFPERIRTVSVEEDDSIHRFEVVDNEDSEWPRIKTVERPYIRTVNPYAFDPPASPTFSDNSYDPPRGRSPARPLPKEPGMMDVPFFSPAYQGYAEGEHTDDEAETPQETPTMEIIAKTLKQNLHGIEAKLPEEPSDRLALPTDGNSQKEEVMPTNVTTLSHEKASNGFPENNTTLLRDDDPAPKTEELYDHVLPEKLGNATHVDESKMPSSLDDTPPSTFSSTGGRTDYDAPNHPHALQADHAVLLSKDLDSDFQGDLVLDGACQAVRDDLVPSKDVRENDAKYGPQHGAMQAEFIGIGAAHGHSP